MLGTGFLLGVVRIPFIVPRIGEPWASWRKCPLWQPSSFSPRATYCVGSRPFVCVAAPCWWGSLPWPLPLGHSRGTHSAVTAATRLSGDAAPDEIVLAAPILESSRFGSATAKPLQDSGVESLRIPVLVLHHSQDACQVSPPAKLPELQAKLPTATSRVITYQGGTSRGAFCEVQAFHSFNGIEQRVADDLSAYISQWQ